MASSLTHRGPDESGFYVSAGVELGMRRLSIIDVEHGHQPAYDESGSVVVVFNGEIYNFTELREELVRGGHHFASSSDTEVIAHLYEDFGASCFEHLRGMFAIAIWDARTRELFLARDRLGKKPLLYTLDPDGGLAFASEARALFRPRGLLPEADLAAVNRVLAFGYANSPHSAYQGVRRLHPGSYLRWQDGEFCEARYWRSQITPEEGMTRQEAEAGVRGLLEEAVRIRLVSERPLGVFLSGGIDSSIVAAIAAKHHDGPLSTFAVGFDDDAFNEAPVARRVADWIGTDHHEAVLKPDPHELLFELQSAYDEPFADSSALPTLLVSRFARQHVVVALTGDGGDEVFGGYERYRALPLIQRLNPMLRVTAPLSSALRGSNARWNSRRARRLAAELEPCQTLAARYCRAMSLLPPGVRGGVWTADAQFEIGNLRAPEDEFLGSLSDTSGSTVHQGRALASLDTETYLPGDLLVKVDIASMSHSLETRAPMLDQELIGFSQRIPDRLLLGQRETKPLLRAIARDLIPADVARRPKMGFGIPRASWIRGPMRELTHDLLLGGTTARRGWFDTQAIQRLLRQHDAGEDLDDHIWPLLAVEVWARGWLH